MRIASMLLFLFFISSCNKGDLEISLLPKADFSTNDQSDGDEVGAIGYKLDGLLEDCQAIIPSADCMERTNNDQTVSATLGQGSIYKIAAPLNVKNGNMDSSVSKIDFSSGKKAIEFAFIIPRPKNVNDSVNYAFYSEMGMFTDGSNVGLGIGFKKDGRASLGIYANNNSIFGQEFDSDEFPERIGILIDKNSNTGRIYFSNNFTASTFTVDFTQAVPMVAFIEQVLELEDQGKKVSFRLITRAEDMQLNYESGTTDFYGTPIN